MDTYYPTTVSQTEFFTMLEDLRVRLCQIEFELPDFLYLHDAQLETTMIPPKDQSPHIEVRRFEGNLVALKRIRPTNCIHIFKTEREVCLSD